MTHAITQDQADQVLSLAKDLVRDLETMTGHAHAYRTALRAALGRSTGCATPP